MHKLKEKLMDELYMFEEKAEKSGNNKLSESELARVQKLTDSVKNICKIDMLEEGGGYSEESNWMADGRMYGTSYEGGSSYARGGRGRGRNAKRDSMGRYSSEGGYSEEGGSYAGGRGGQGGGGSRGGQGGSRGGSSYGGYSRDGGDMMERLEEMMEEASTPKQREAIKRCMHELDE